MDRAKDFPDDATPTYRGYRRQALYCLHRLFDDGLPNDSVVQPEGTEDLAIRDATGETLEVVQVKDHTADLTASAFKPSFYRRISALCRSHPSVEIKIVSFGPVGQELARAYDNTQDSPKRTLNTLTKDREEVDSKGNRTTILGLSEEEAEEVFTRVELQLVDEATLKAHVIRQLSATMTSGDPQVAFENLMWWLISSAEKQRKLTRSLTIEKISVLGRFLTYRAAHEHEWNISIKPIRPTSPDGESREKLKQEFFQGGRVRAEHVAAGLDVRRDELLQSVHNGFQQEHIVILRAASGQGKTTLAYRYLLDWSPTDFRFQIERAADLQHARRMAAALAGHVEAIDVPTVVYIDVRPGDNLWVDVVRELVGVTDIRVLVTIREEDWFRSRVTKDEFAFVDLSLPFTEDTGERLFTELRSIGYGNAHLDFKDAWSRLGDRKTLFEFVYLTTQNEELTERIRAQIAALKDEANAGQLARGDLQLLRLVAVASAYEARVNLKDLSSCVEIPELARTLQRFSDEYLLRTSSDGQYVEGFHAIRSEILVVELTDSVLQPRGEIEAALPRLLCEDDLESFLMCSFSRNKGSAERLVGELYNTKLQTWVGVRGVLVALLWLGLKKYADDNTNLIDEVRLVSTTSWWVMLDWDLAQVKGQDGFGFFRILAQTSEEYARAAEVAAAFQERQTSKDTVFTYAARWLGSFDVPTDNDHTASQFVAMSEVLYWLGHVQCNEAVAAWLDARVISDAWYALPLYLFARFASGVQKFRPELYDSWLQDNQVEVESGLRKRSSTIALVKEDDCLVAHFAIDLNRKASGLMPAEEEASINDLAVQRVEVVSACLPGFGCYGASGYGHRMSFFDGFGDDSTKRMPIENVIMSWLPEFNALARGVVEYRFRPDTWDAYFAGVRSMREKVVAAFQDLCTTASEVLKGGNAPLVDAARWDECKQLVNGEFFLPKVAVDEWGFVTESRAKQFNSNRAKMFSAISTLDPFNRAINEYTRAVAGFLMQSLQALVLIPNLNTARTATERRAVVAKGKELGVEESSIRMSVVNGMDAVIALRQLHRVERSLLQGSRMAFDERFRDAELEAIISTMRSWALFCYPEQIAPKRAKQRQKRRPGNKSRQRIELRDCLRATTNRIAHALKLLKADGIDARMMSEDVRWNEESALWISFDTSHPLESLIAVEKLWRCLIEAFRPDRDKIVRVKAFDWYWQKIVLVPLVHGRSLEMQAMANIDAVAYLLNEDLESQQWRLIPEDIPDTAWKELGLRAWERQPSWDTFDEFATAYGELFRHVDHMADFTRCKADLDELGEEIVRNYLKVEEKRAEPFLQETLDSCAALLRQFSEPEESVVAARPNLLDCIHLIVAMEDAILPSSRFVEEGGLTLEEMVDWRNRLKGGFNLLGEARPLWIADSLGFGAFNASDLS